MECHEAQAHLELSTLERQTLSGPEALKARQHLADCDACHLAVESMQRFDREVAQAMIGVPIPDGLTERLHRAVQAVTTLPVGKSSASAGKHSASPMSKQSWRRVATMTSVAIMMFLLVSRFMSREAQLSVADVQRIAGIDPNLLPAAPPETSYQIPVGWKNFRGLELSGTPRLKNERDASVVIVPMMVRIDRRSAPSTGLLMVLPASRWPTHPEAESFSSATVQYASFGTWVVWQERGTVFVCVLRSDTRGMERLQSLIANRRELT
jgi:hypothetical protein